MSMFSNLGSRTRWLGQPPELWLGVIVFVLSMTVILPNASSGIRVAIASVPVLGLLLVALGLYRIARDRNYYRQPVELWLGALAFVLLQVLVLPIGLTSGSGNARIAIGLLPLLALLLVARGLYRIVRDQDELYRRIRLEAFAYAAGIVVFLSFVLSTLEQMAVMQPIGSSWAGLALIFAWVIAAAVLDRRYR
jgi:hypothetical protein